MRKLLSAVFIAGFLSIAPAKAQIELAKLIHKDYRDMLPGFGASFAFAVPVTESEAGGVTVEVGALVFLDKDYPDAYGVAIVPIKVGFRYILSGNPSGFYVHPQVGYNVFGYEANYTDAGEIDRRFNGFIWAAGIGYLFPPGRGIQFNIALRYETVLDSGTPKNFIGLRLSHNFTFGRRE